MIVIYGTIELAILMNSFKFPSNELSVMSTYSLFWKQLNLKYTLLQTSLSLWVNWHTTYGLLYISMWLLCNFLQVLIFGFNFRNLAK